MLICFQVLCTGGYQLTCSPPILEGNSLCGQLDYCPALALVRTVLYPRNNKVQYIVNLFIKIKVEKKNNQLKRYNMWTLSKRTIENVLNIIKTTH